MQAFRRLPNHQLFYADLGAYPDLAVSLNVDLSPLSVELPSVLQLKPDGTGKVLKRLPLKSEPEDDSPPRVQTVKLGTANLRRYFD